MLKLAFHFPPNQNDYWDLDLTYRNAFESMSSYPPVELFEDTSNNKILNMLRIRCYNANLLIDSPKTPILNIYKRTLFENLDRKLFDIIHDDLVIQLNRLEARIVLEIYINHLNNNNAIKINTTLLNTLALQL